MLNYERLKVEMEVIRKRFETMLKRDGCDTPFTEACFRLGQHIETILTRLEMGETPIQISDWLYRSYIKPAMDDEKTPA